MHMYFSPYSYLKLLLVTCLGGLYPSLASNFPSMTNNSSQYISQEPPLITNDQRPLSIQNVHYANKVFPIHPKPLPYYIPTSTPSFSLPLNTWPHSQTTQSQTSFIETTPNNPTRYSNHPDQPSSQRHTQQSNLTHQSPLPPSNTTLSNTTPHSFPPLLNYSNQCSSYQVNSNPVQQCHSLSSDTAPTYLQDEDIIIRAAKILAERKRQHHSLHPTHPNHHSSHSSSLFLNNPNFSSQVTTQQNHLTNPPQLPLTNTTLSNTTPHSFPPLLNHSTPLNPPYASQITTQQNNLTTQFIPHFPQKEQEKDLSKKTSLPEDTGLGQSKTKSPSIDSVHSKHSSKKKIDQVLEVLDTEDISENDRIEILTLIEKKLTKNSSNNDPKTSSEALHSDNESNIPSVPSPKSSSQYLSTKSDPRYYPKNRSGLDKKKESLSSSSSTPSYSNRSHSSHLNKLNDNNIKPQEFSRFNNLKSNRRTSSSFCGKNSFNGKKSMYTKNSHSSDDYCFFDTSQRSNPRRNHSYQHYNASYETSHNTSYNSNNRRRGRNRIKQQPTWNESYLHSSYSSQSFHRGSFSSHSRKKTRGHQATFYKKKSTTLPLSSHTKQPKQEQAPQEVVTSVKEQVPPVIQEDHSNNILSDPSTHLPTNPSKQKEEPLIKTASLASDKKFSPPPSCAPTPPLSLPVTQPSLPPLSPSKVHQNSHNIHQKKKTPHKKKKKKKVTNKKKKQNSSISFHSKKSLHSGFLGGHLVAFTSYHLSQHAKIIAAEQMYDLKQISSLILKNEDTFDTASFYALFFLTKIAQAGLPQLTKTLLNNESKGQILFETKVLPYLHKWLKKNLVKQEQKEYKRVASHILHRKFPTLSPIEKKFFLYALVIAHQLIKKIIPLDKERKETNRLVDICKHRDFNGNNLLLVAQHHNHLEITQWLIEKYSFDPFPRNRNGKNLLDEASPCKEKRREVTSYLKKYIPTAPSTPLPALEKKELKLAIQENNADKLEKCLKKINRHGLLLAQERFKIDDKVTRPPSLLLHFAIYHFKKEDPTPLQLLLKYSTKQALFLRDQEGNNAVLSCAIFNQLEALSILFAFHPHIDCNSRNKEGKTALHYSTIHHHSLPLLLFKQENNTAMYSVDASGSTPFTYACRKTLKPFIQYYLKQGYQPNMPYEGKECALTTCLAEKLFDSLHIIFEMTTKKEQYAYININGRKVHIVFSLLTYYNTSHHIADQQKYLDFMKYIYQKKYVDLQEKDPEGVTLEQIIRGLHHEDLLHIFALPKQHMTSSSFFKEEEKQYLTFNTETLCISSQMIKKVDFISTNPIEDTINGPIQMVDQPIFTMPSFTSLGPKAPLKMMHRLLRIIIQENRFSIEEITLALTRSLQFPKKKDLPIYNVKALIYLIYSIKPYISQETFTTWTALKKQVLETIEQITSKFNKALLQEAQEYCKKHEENPIKWPEKKANMAYCICAANNWVKLFKHFYEKQKLYCYDQDGVGGHFLFYLKSQELLDYCIKSMHIDPLCYTSMGVSLSKSWQAHSYISSFSCKKTHAPLDITPYLNQLYEARSTQEQAREKKELIILFKKKKVHAFTRRICQNYATTAYLLDIAKELASKHQIYLLEQLITPENINCFLDLVKNKLLFPLYREQGSLYQNALHRLASKFLDLTLLKKWMKDYPYLDINSRDSRGNTVLFYYVELLIKRDIKEKEGKKYLNAFIQLNASPWVQNANAETILFLCTRKAKRIWFIQYFVQEHQVDIRISNKNHLSLMTLAQQHKKWQLVSYFKRHWKER